MSRSGYVEDCDFEDELAAARYRGRVASAIRGKRGQAFLREMLAALDAMPDKRLIERELVNEQGEVCAMGCVATARGLDVKDVDPEESGIVANLFGIAEVLVREIAFENDEAWGTQSPEIRWRHMRGWVERRIKQEGDK